MKPAQSLFNPFIDKPVVFKGGFPAHTADQSPITFIYVFPLMVVF